MEVVEDCRLALAARVHAQQWTRPGFTRGLDVGGLSVAMMAYRTYEMDILAPVLLLLPLPGLRKWSCWLRVCRTLTSFSFRREHAMTGGTARPPPPYTTCGEHSAQL
jgi:hypothetical protein